MNYFNVRKSKKVALAFFFSVFFCVSAFAQQTLVKGVVEDNQGEPIIGAYVTVKGAAGVGTITDYDGNFELNVSSSATLIFSYTGYQRKEIPVAGKTSLKVTLAEEAIGLNEVVFTGYGSQTKREVTGSVSSVKAESFNKGIVANPVGLLQGKVAGLNITKLGGGDPTNKDFNIQLRGVGSLKGNAQPLFIIDGVPGGDINSVNPNDIESIDVLKDGSAAAIYGTRANAGVILITTKRGQEGKTKAEYSGSFGADVIAKKLRVLTADEYRTLVGGTDEGGNTDWLSEITRPVAFSQQHNVAISGGGKGFNYRGSVGYKSNQGLAIESEYQEVLARLAANQKTLNDKLELAYDFSYSHNDKTWVDYEAFNQALKNNPTRSVFYDPSVGADPLNPNYADYYNYGGYVETDGFSSYNPVSIIRGIDDDGRADVFLGSVRATLSLTNKLRLGTFVSYQTGNEWTGKYWDKTTKYNEGYSRNGIASHSYKNYQNQLIENTLQYTDQIAAHSISGLLGQSYQYNVWSGFSATNTDFITNLYSYNNLGAGMGVKNNDDRIGMGSYQDSDKLASFFARAMYNYNQKYYVNASIRMEGSSRFGPQAHPVLGRYGLFPAISGSWRMKEESFLRSVKDINDLKIRAGVGVTGNIPGTTNLYFEKVGPTGNYLWLDGEFVQPWGITSNVNENLRWEKKTEYNLGIDGEFFNSKLSATLDGYYRNTTDLLWEYEMPQPPYPFGTMWDNHGQIENYGVEMAVNGNVFKNSDWKIDAGIVAAWNRNMVTRITSGYTKGKEGANLPYLNVGYLSGDGLTGVNIMRLEEGKPIGNFYGYKFIRINEEGKMVYERLNSSGDVIGETTSTSSSVNMQVIGNAQPLVTGGFNVNVSYKQFDLTANFRGQIGGKIFNFKRFYYENKNINLENYLLSAFEGDAAKLTTDDRVFSDFYLEDGTYLRLSDVTLGYNVKTNTEIAKYFTDMRVTFTVQNAFVLTSYTGVDPEVNQGGLDPGIDGLNYYPKQRSFLLGLNFTF
ncbi:MAG TPA: SusC/RagA family TonB-linked outer membrane protein [Paludibacteraceae bacterium]|nr:SusC/RagA family TonB-linked outer membrane protein [Paludibacteraceae bacterium]